MSKILRWLREIFNPSSKCERMGHEFRRVRIRGKAYPPKMFRSVADEAYKSFHRCGRCGKVEDREGDGLQRYGGIQSLTMPDDMWKRLYEDGFLPD